MVFLEGVKIFILIGWVWGVWERGGRRGWGGRKVKVLIFENVVS